LLRGHRHVFFANIFHHPVVLQDSHMESMRVVARDRSVIVRILEDGVRETLYRNVSKFLLSSARPLLGVSSIPDRPE
jgi:hypothetical protein